MESFVALLRAVNVGGRTIRMEELRALFTEMGFEDVRTMLASGNVLFKTTVESPAGLEARIGRRLEAGFGYEVTTFVRTAAEMAAVAGSTVTSEDDRSRAAGVRSTIRGWNTVQKLAALR